MNSKLFKSGIAAVALMLSSTTGSLAQLGFGCPVPGGMPSRDPCLEPAPGVSTTPLAKPVDMGSLTAQGRGGETMSVTLSLALGNLAGAEAMMVRLATPGDALFHQFMTPAEIRASFGPNEAEVSKAMSILTLSGFEVERPTTTTLTVTGPVSTMERVFNTELHQFSVAETDMAPGFTFHAAMAKPTIPQSIAGIVQGTIGFNDAPQFKSDKMAAPSSFGGTPVAAALNTASDGTPFGVLTVKDFDTLYDVNPIQAQGINGEGRTLAVVTLAAFTPSDAQKNGTR